jgi:hypothetical protein
MHQTCLKDAKALLDELQEPTQRADEPAICPPDATYA